MILTGRQILARNIFTPQTVRTVHEATGMTYGASYAGYDVRLKQDIRIYASGFSLASTLEKFEMPNDTIAIVHDKSSLARQGLSVQNTVIEPGWSGYLTLELTNHGYDILNLIAGQPIAQIIFHRLDEALEEGYSGRYQNQPDRPVAALVKKTWSG
jgi:dCTP deaminase